MHAARGRVGWDRARGIARALHLGLVWVLAGALATAAPGEEGAGESAGEAPSTPPEVDLQQLLKLPSTLDYSIQSRGGATRGEWRARFETNRRLLAEERAALELAQSELEELAGSTEAWQVGPPIPGATPGEAPLDFRLRQKLRRHRQEIERLERERRALEVEANLAGVPPDWRE